MTVMTILHLVFAFVSAHWHKVVGTLAFFMAAYNHFRHNKLLKQFTGTVGTKSATKPTKKLTIKFKKFPKSKSKKRR